MRRGKVFDSSDPDLRHALPQHDFNIPEVNITPSSFRFLRMKVEHINGNTLNVIVVISFYLPLCRKICEIITNSV